MYVRITLKDKVEFLQESQFWLGRFNISLW